MSALPVTQAVPASRKRASEDTVPRDDGASSESSSKRRNVEGRAVGTAAHPPSLVVHVRALPAFTTEAELTALLQPYGAVERAFVTQHNHQAFVQMASIEAAEAVVSHAATPPGFTLRGRQIFLQYSTRTKVEPPPNPNSNVPMAPRDPTASGYSAPGHHEAGTPNSVLLLSVTNLKVPVTLDNVHAICKPSGPVWKIITFMKGQNFKALVQFGTVEAAVHAQANLDGKSIFQGCCHVSAAFSSQPQLTISQTGPKARDFLAEGAVENTPTPPMPPNAAVYAQQIHQQQQQAAAVAQQQQVAAAAAQQQGQMPPPQQQQGQMGYPPSWPGFNGMPMGPMNPYGHAMPPMQMPPNPYAHLAGVMGYPTPYGAPMPGAPSAPTGVYTTGQQTVNAAGGAGSVLIVSQLPVTPDITPEALFHLFGIYGDVVRVKIMFERRHTALIQFTSPQGCQQAIQNLNGVMLDGKQLKVSISKHDSISPPKAGSTADANGDAKDEFTQDFTNSKLHRFRGKPATTAAKNLHPPSQVLHVGNIPDGASLEDLQRVFGPSSTPQFFVTDRHMAYVKLPSVSDAILALMRTHNHRLHGRPLRVSFSAKTTEAFDEQQQQQHPSPQPTTDGMQA